MSEIKGVAVNFFIFDSLLQKVVLVKSLGDAFSLPSGYFYDNEDFLDGCLRVFKVIVEVDALPDIYLLSSENNLGLVHVNLASVMSPRVELSNQILWMPLEDISRYELLQKTTIEDVWSAKNRLVFERDIIQIGQVTKTIDRAIQLMIRSVNRVGDDIGWDHNLNIRDRIGIIGTSLGILGLSQNKGSQHLPLLIQAADTLLNKQHPTGGWGTKSLQDGGFPVIHSTAYAIWALSALNRDKDKDAIQKAESWLQLTQKDGGWGVDEFSNLQTVTATTLGLTALSKADMLPRSRESAVQWLKDAQYPGGGWGAFSFRDKSNDKPTASHTSRALYALREAGFSKSEKFIIEGVDWMLKNCPPDGVWPGTAESAYTANNLGRLEFKHAGHQWALIGLLRCGMSLNNPKLLGGISQLVYTQNDSGGWDHDLAPGHIPTWATVDGITALSMTQENAFPLLLAERYLNRQKPLRMVLNSLVYIGKSLERSGTQLIVQPNEIINHASEISNLPLTSVSKSVDGINIWKQGAFFLVVMLVLILATVLISIFVNSAILPIALIFILIAFLLVVISVLRQTNQVSSDNFMDLVKEAMRPLGLLVGKKHDSDARKNKNDKMD